MCIHVYIHTFINTSYTHPHTKSKCSPERLIADVPNPCDESADVVCRRLGHVGHRRQNGVSRAFRSVRTHGDVLLGEATKMFFSGGKNRFTRKVRTKVSGR